MATCSIPCCPQRAEARGLCRRHYREWRHGAPHPAPLQRTPKGAYAHCTVAGCERAHYAKGLCVRHYQRQWLGIPMEGTRFKTGEAHPNSKLHVFP